MTSLHYKADLTPLLLEAVENATRTTETANIGVTLWQRTVVVSLVSLLLTLVLGAALNVGFIGLMCRENFASKQKYTFWMNLIFVNALLCVIWVPMKGVVLAQLYFNSSIDADLVLAELNVYVLFMSVSFFSVVFIVILKICYLLEVRKRNTASIVTFGLTFIWILSFIWMVLQNFIKGEVGVTYIMCKNISAMLNFHEKVNNDSTEAMLATTLTSTVNFLLTLILVLAWQHRYRKVLYSECTKKKRRNFSQPTISINIESVDDDEPTDARRSSTSHSILSKSDSAPPVAGSARRSFVYFQDSKGEYQDTLGTPVDSRGIEAQRDRRMSQLSNSMSCDRRLSQLSGEALPVPGRLKHCPRYMDANTYDYVQKWSVDVFALQNQLSNPTLSASPYTYERERKRSNQDDLLSVRWSDYRGDFTSPRPSKADTGFHSLDSISVNDTVTVHKMEMETPTPSRRRSSILQSPMSTVRREADKTEVRGCITLLVLALLTALPVLILNLFQWSLTTDLYFNVHLTLVALGALQIVIQPFILIRMDRSVKTKVLKAQHRFKSHRTTMATSTV